MVRGELGAVGRGDVKSNLKQDASLGTRQCLGDRWVVERDAAIAVACIVEVCCPCHTDQTRNDDLPGQPIKKRLARVDVDRLVVVLARFQVKLDRGFEANVDVFREAFDDAVALGERCPTLELEFPALSLQAPEAMHQPVILFDQIGIDGKRTGKLAEKFRKNRMLVQKWQLVTHTRSPPLWHFALASCRHDVW